MSALENFELGKDIDTQFGQRVQSLVVKVASQIVGETNQTTEALRKRHNLAVEILNDTGKKKTQAFLQAIAALGTLNGLPVEEVGHSTDNDIEFTINSVFNDIAGVYKSEETAASSTTRVLNYNELYQLVNNSGFVSKLEAAALKKAIYFKNLYTVWANLSDQEKKRLNWAKTALRAGAIENNTGFAKVFGTYLINDAVGIAINDAGFNADVVTSTMVTAGTLDGAVLDKVIDIWAEEVDITQEV